jgi:propanediol dehydratase large subunit
MTEPQAKTLAENLASALHQLALVEAQRAVEEYRARHEPGVVADVEGLKQGSVQARRDLESALTRMLLEITAQPAMNREPDADTR